MGRTAKGNTDEQEIGEARNFGLPDMLYDVAARVATTRVGQFAYKRVDNLLWTVEKTARWSLPQSFPAEVGLAATRASAPGGDDEDLKASNISGPPLVRPLPWLLFLPALILLRMIRTTLSVATLAIGRGPVLPSAMVGFLQNKRRKLRALKYRGQRLQRIRKVEREGGQQRATWFERFRTLEPLRMLLCSSRPYVDANSDVAHAIVFRKDRPTHRPKRTAAKKRSLNQREADSDGETGSDHDSCEDANCQELLEKYAHVADDSSFNVEDVTSASDTTDSCASDVEPSPKKNNVETGPAAEQHQQNGGQHKGHSNSKSDLESPVAKADEPSKVPPSKSMDAANRSKSATGLENSSATAATSSDAKLTSSSSTPSKSIPNLSSSPENNENKPLNQNVPGKASSSSSPQSGRKIVAVAPATKQSPSAAQADGSRSSSVQQQQHKPARSQPVATTTQQQQHQQHQLPQQQPSQQYFSNGGKNRPKKPTNHSVA
ncbi:zinc finger protein rotund [Anopheles cruzii]|uniref:zinc finger protein rotund n=1 Tax=Anopheles cruzii TaxID=68878 RepID=UPI0022EC80C6|nr:zinc finger protein rotund [Anopheles cruzii]